MYPTCLQLAIDGQAIMAYRNQKEFVSGCGAVE